MFNIANVKLELFSDPDMCIFFEKGIRANFSYISNRYSRANNKNLKSYDPQQESKLIIYLDRNNLYGYAMSKFLPAGVFEGIYPKEFDLARFTCHYSKGCDLEIDLEYRKELQKLHNDYLLAPRKKEMKRVMLSEY